MRDVAYRVRIRLDNEHGCLGLAGAVGSVIHEIVHEAEMKGILSAGATIALAHLLSVELVDPQSGDVVKNDSEISVGGDDPEQEDSSSPEA